MAKVTDIQRCICNVLVWLQVKKHCLNKREVIITPNHTE